MLNAFEIAYVGNANIMEDFNDNKNSKTLKDPEIHQIKMQ